ncbi:MAG: FMN adenylyltransferase [Candidatus Taylorbacteria bacterium CG11_big_fil_rev_8_21_14_0_20_46_11]|uniref:riboflavin kinase n=1 Tax=Candidatus Taylorbacteria bacterium CG11_big_fil_rev_8_21_14_0_20_46_11 TaxID=1975025 RepID=A0A2H0KBJ4_9BACT|nr:MAG: FMN adenylyltransferase [Candidatus Taylorbacteria bacterium CG11_big_fil_rev_8_21_14_0_20_46_11]
MKRNTKTISLTSGTVIHGQGYGRKLGFPTANLELANSSKKLLNVPTGVYAGIATIQLSGKTYKSGIVVEPEAKGKPVKVEAHLLDFSGDLYDLELRLELQAYVRPFLQFGTEQELIKQIRADIALIEKITKLLRKGSGKL